MRAFGKLHHSVAHRSRGLMSAFFVARPGMPGRHTNLTRGPCCRRRLRRGSGRRGAPRRWTSRWRVVSRAARGGLAAGRAESGGPRVLMQQGIGALM